MRTNNNFSARTLVDKIDANQSKTIEHLIFVVANMHIIVFNGITLTATASRSFFCKNISLFDSSLSALEHILTTEDANSKKYQHMFRHVIDNMSDATDDSSLEVISERVSQFEKYVEQLFASSEIEFSSANINTANANEEITQSLTIVLSEQKPIIKENVKDLTKKGEDTL